MFAMPTFPLAVVAAHLRRHGALAALDGAPYQPDPGGNDLDVLDCAEVARGIVADGGLWLGRSEISPAALGWATAALALAKGVDRPVLVSDRDGIELWSAGHQGSAHRWAWSGSDHVGSWLYGTSLAGAAPATPVARLAAVLAHELKP